MLEEEDHMGISSPHSCMKRKSADLSFEVKDNMDEEKNVREKGKRKKKRKRTNCMERKAADLTLVVKRKRKRKRTKSVHLESEPANLIPEKEYDKFTEQSAMTGNEYLDEEQRESVHMKYLPNLKRRKKDDAENEQEAVAYADKKVENARAEVAVAESKLAKAMKKLTKAEQEVSAAAYDDDAKKIAVLHRDLAVTSVHSANTNLDNANAILKNAIALQCLKIATAAEHVNVMHPPAGPSSNGLRPEVEARVISACTYTDKYEKALEKVTYHLNRIGSSESDTIFKQYALLIAFFSDLSDDEKKVIKKCYTSKDFTTFLHNMKMNKLLNIVFIVDQFDAFDSDKFMKDGTCTNQQKIDAKLMLQSVMSDFKKVFVLSQSDGCTNPKAGNDDLFNQYIDLSEPLDQEDWLNWAQIRSSHHPQYHGEYLSLILGETLEVLTAGCKDENAKVMSVIEYFSGRHCLFYSWFYQESKAFHCKWQDAIRKFKLLAIEDHVKALCANTNILQILELCVMKITTCDHIVKDISLCGNLAKVYAYVCTETIGGIQYYHYDVASEFIRNKIRFALRSYVRQGQINMFDKRLDNIKISLRNETHASNFGFTMEDAVIMTLETSGDILAKMISEVFCFTPSSTNHDVFRFTMNMKSKERPKKDKKWWHFGQIDTELGRIMDDKYQQINALSMEQRTSTS
ncbi:hypothetical protein EMCRGX_G018613 [Ephydatia muelleri]